MREEIPAHLIDTANCHHYTSGIYPVTYLGAGRYLGMLPDRRIPGGRNGKGYGEKTEFVNSPLNSLIQNFINATQLFLAKRQFVHRL